MAQHCFRPKLRQSRRVRLRSGLLSNFGCDLPWASANENCKVERKNEYEWVANFKIAQKVMTAQNIAKPLPIDKLVKGKYQDNLEFLQWFKDYFECRFGGQPYDAVGRRALGVGGASSGIGGAVKPAPRATAVVAAPAKKPPTAAAKKVTPTPSPKPKPESASMGKADGQQKEKLLAQIAELESQMEGFEKERDFYFGKLREVEIFCQNAEGDDFSKEKVVAILYKTDEGEAGVEETPAAAEEPEETF